jgi:hypothetical protein
MKTATHDWLTREWRRAHKMNSTQVWNELWWQLMGARRLALDLGLDDLEDDLTTVSNLADYFSGVAG